MKRSCILKVKSHLFMLFLFYLFKFCLLKTLLRLPEHYSIDEFDIEGYDYVSDYKQEKNFYIFSVGGEGFLNFSRNPIGRPIHLEDDPLDAAPFYIWEDDEMGGLILGTKEFYDDPEDEVTELLDYDPKKELLTVSKYEHTKNQRFYFHAVGLNLYKIQHNDQCLHYDSESDRIGVRECQRTPGDEAQLFELYNDDDMLQLVENDDDREKDSDDGKRNRRGGFRASESSDSEHKDDEKSSDRNNDGEKNVEDDESGEDIRRERDSINHRQRGNVNLLPKDEDDGNRSMLEQENHPDFAMSSTKKDDEQNSHTPRETFKSKLKRFFTGK